MRVRTKADLVKLVESLPDDLHTGIYVDIADAVQWMADPNRQYHQGGSTEDGTVPGEHPCGYPKRHHYFLIFSPEPIPKRYKDGDPYTCEICETVYPWGTAHACPRERTPQ